MGIILGNEVFQKLMLPKKQKKNFDKNVILDYLLFLIDFENKIAILGEENLE